jgi:hypothetical protein
MSNRRYRGVKMINLRFLWFLQKCHRNCWELKLAHAHSGQPRGESLTGSLDFDARCTLARVSRYWSQERASWCTGLSPLRWSVAGHDASQLVQFGISGWRQELSRAHYPVCKGKQPANVDDGEGIVRPIASKSAIALHLGLPHSWGALFFFKISK